MVGTSGLEPPTSRLSGVRSNHLSYAPKMINLLVFVSLPRPFGGDEEDRTPDPLLAKQVLSQLSYTPMFFRDWLVFSSSVNVPHSTFKIEQQPSIKLLLTGYPQTFVFASCFQAA